MRLYPYLILLMLGSLLPEALANFQIRSRQIGGTLYVKAQDIATYYGLQMQRNGRDVTLSGGEQSVELTIGRRSGSLNGVGVHYAFAPTTSGSDVYLSERDFTLLIDPVLRDWGLPAHRVRRIVIDPGHGGKDDGTRGDRFREKHLVLTVSERLADILREKGYEVVLTRQDDRFIELEDRPAIAEQVNADLFISVHFNAAGSRQAHGIETFVVTPRDTPSTPSNDKQDSTVPGNANDILNHRLGYELHRYLVGMTGAKDRGLKKMRFAVLRTATVPAVLLELGFLSNRQEEERIASAAYQETLARAMANGIISFDRILWTNSQRR